MSIARFFFPCLFFNLCARGTGEKDQEGTNQKEKWRFVPWSFSYFFLSLFSFHQAVKEKDRKRKGDRNRAGDLEVFFLQFASPFHFLFPRHVINLHWIRAWAHRPFSFLLLINEEKKDGGEKERLTVDRIFLGPTLIFILTRPKGEDSVSSTVLSFSNQLQLQLEKEKRKVEIGSWVLARPPFFPYFLFVMKIREGKTKPTLWSYLHPLPLVF